MFSSKDPQLPLLIKSYSKQKFKKEFKNRERGDWLWSIRSSKSLIASWETCPISSSVSLFLSLPQPKTKIWALFFWFQLSVTLLLQIWTLFFCVYSKMLDLRDKETKLLAKWRDDHIYIDIWVHIRDRGRLERKKTKRERSRFKKGGPTERALSLLHQQQSNLFLSHSSSLFKKKKM